MFIYFMAHKNTTFTCLQLYFIAKLCYTKNNLNA